MPTRDANLGIKSTAQWVEYFRGNAAKPWPIDWALGAEVTDEELAIIGKSLQAWQLGETSDGGHLRAIAARHAEQIDEPEYAEAVELFIREEQKHGEMLGQFLDRAGIGRVQSNWGDSLFRLARYFLPNMEAWTTPVLMVETLALVYYNAIRRSTRSRMLRAICSRILADEIPHLRFQCERLAAIFRSRPRLAFRLTMLAHRVGFFGVMLLVWLANRRALRAGGYHGRRYWRAAWNRMEACWRMVDPERYFPSQKRDYLSLAAKR